MQEKNVEQQLVRAVKAMGGFSPKLVSPGTDGMPDRLVLFPGGKLAFVEMKAPGKKMRPLQVRRKGQLEALGFRVYCVDRLEQIAVEPWHQECDRNSGLYTKGRLEYAKRGMRPDSNR